MITAKGKRRNKMLNSLLNEKTERVSSTNFYARTMKQFLAKIEKALSNEKEISQAPIIIDDDYDGDETQVTATNGGETSESDVPDAELTMLAVDGIECIAKSGRDMENDSDCEIVEVVSKKRKLIPFSLPRSVTKNMTSKLPNEIEIQDIGKSGKTYSVLNPKYLSNEHKLLLSKRCTTFDEYVKKYLKIMDVNEKNKNIC